VSWIDVASPEEVQAMIDCDAERFGNVLATAESIKVNLNDRVRFRIKADSLRLFHAVPGIEIAREPEGEFYPAVAQLHVLLGALEGHLKPWLIPPIATTLEFPVEVSR